MISITQNAQAHGYNLHSMKGIVKTIVFSISPLERQWHMVKRTRCSILSPLSNINWAWCLGHVDFWVLCSINLYACFCASTRLFWLQWLCNIVWYLVLWSLQLASSFSRLLWLLGVFFGSINIFIFLLDLWNTH